MFESFFSSQEFSIYFSETKILNYNALGCPLRVLDHWTHCNVSNGQVYVMSKHKQLFVLISVFY